MKVVVKKPDKLIDSTIRKNYLNFFRQNFCVNHLFVMFLLVLSLIEITSCLRYKFKLKNKHKLSHSKSNEINYNSFNTNNSKAKFFGMNNLETPYVLKTVSSNNEKSSITYNNDKMRDLYK